MGFLNRRLNKKYLQFTTVIHENISLFSLIFPRAYFYGLLFYELYESFQSLHGQYI